MGAQLSTTSEGLWLTAALSGVTRLPAALRVRPVGDTEAMLASHPGLQVLEEAGVCQGRTLDPDVQEWLWTLGRCDIDVSIRVSRPDAKSERLTGPQKSLRRQRIRSKSLLLPRQRYAHGAHTNLPIGQRFCVAVTVNGLSQRACGEAVRNRSTK